MSDDQVFDVFFKEKITVSQMEKEIDEHFKVMPKKEYFEAEKTLIKKK